MATSNVPLKEMHKVKVSVLPVRIRGKRQFMVSWKPKGDKRKRKYFPTRSAADVEAESLRGEHHRIGGVWLSITQSERNEIGYAFSEAKSAGFSLLEAVRFCKANRKPNDGVTVAKAYEDFIKKVEKSLVSKNTISALRSNVGRWVSTCSAVPLRKIAHSDVFNWLSRPEWGPRTFNTYLTSLNTFFIDCVKLDLIEKSPTRAIEKIDERRMPDLDTPPAVLNSEQAKALLKATWETDRGLIPFVAVQLFGALRPEREAAKLSPGDIRMPVNADLERLVQVRGLHAKDRQRRYIHLHSTLEAWLRLGGDYPIKNLRRRFEKVRVAAGLITVKETEAGKEIEWTGWAQDVLRHTCASHYLPLYGAEKTIELLGHGNYDMLFGHYRAMVTRSEAEAYFALTPVAVLGSIQSGNKAAHNVQHVA